MKKILLVVALLLISGCHKDTGLAGKAFRMQQNGKDTPVVLEFSKDEPRYYGAVVNRYFGSYELNGDNIKFNAGGTTMMMGAPDEMKLEREYLDTLPQVVSYTSKGKTLTLTTVEGKILRFIEMPPSAN